MKSKDVALLSIPPKAGQVAHQRVIKMSGIEETFLEDQLAVEEPLEIRLGGRSLTVTMRTPGDDEDLVAGFLFGEQVIERADEIEVMSYYRNPDDPDVRNVINVLLRGDVRVFQKRLQRNFFTSSSCGLCGKATIEALKVHVPPVETNFAVPLDLLYGLDRELRVAQSTFERTGGLHAAGVFDRSGRLLILREDIGRHNAVDKVIGHMLLSRKLPLDQHLLMVSGRASFEIMQKALVARVPIVVAVSAPSSLAVQLATECNMTLVGFLRGGSLNIYAGSHRLASGHVLL